MKRYNKKTFREERYQQLIEIIGNATIISKKFYHPVDKCNFRCSLSFTPTYLPRVQIESLYYQGDLPKEFHKYLNQKWIVYDKLFTKYADSKVSLDNLSVEDFLTLCSILTGNITLAQYLVEV